MFLEKPLSYYSNRLCIILSVVWFVLRLVTELGLISGDVSELTLVTAVGVLQSIHVIPNESFKMNKSGADKKTK